MGDGNEKGILEHGTEQGSTNRKQGEGGCELGQEENHTSLSLPHLLQKWSMSSVAKVGHKP